MSTQRLRRPGDIEIRTGISEEGVPVGWGSCGDCDQMHCPFSHTMDEDTTLWVRGAVFEEGEWETASLPVCQVGKCKQRYAEALRLCELFSHDPDSFEARQEASRLRAHTRGPVDDWRVIRAGQLLKVHEFYLTYPESVCIQSEAVGVE